ncbi:LOW QUALITY PROTEIN: galactoside 2-alpha-L-fucosyltransferase 1 [Monodon monoceros]|uniref:LOW QUALITY PROTEIN: galactoside 2-alpha-L-fucosyltransferase 1 n=1 Tax=Monodon monoceros TaxID=40151 RepID=UPI0010F9C32A|nr:LOW QUALITY PROTEIN: galactoside 2-alpha-L-fucosyltransferase 1 [Monodon monoceros]
MGRSGDRRPLVGAGTRSRQRLSRRTQSRRRLCTRPWSSLVNRFCISTGGRDRGRKPLGRGRTRRILVHRADGEPRNWRGRGRGRSPALQLGARSRCPRKDGLLGGQETRSPIQAWTSSLSCSTWPVASCHLPGGPCPSHTGSLRKELGEHCPTSVDLTAWESEIPRREDKVPCGHPGSVTCLTFLLTCVFTSIFFFHIHQDLFHSGLGLSALCPDRNPVTSPVAIICLSGTPMSPNASVSCPKHPASLSGTWTIYPNGRLGNQMGQYATLLALAQLNGRQACIQPAMHATLAPVFRITLPVLAPEVNSRTPWWELELHDWMLEEYARLKEPWLKLSGFPCSWTFFHHLREQIRSEFTLHDHLQREAQSLLSQFRLSRTGDRPSTFVGVHVRRGDYLKVMPYHWKGVVGDRAYLQQAMDWFRARHEAPIFVVTSNGMEWCRENIDTSRGDVIFAGDGQEGAPSKDFGLLTQCNHTIMTIGTFGFWAAYLAGGNTVYLANFTLPNSSFLNIFKPKAAFLPEWVGINADLTPLQMLAEH